MRRLGIMIPAAAAGTPPHRGSGPRLRRAHRPERRREPAPDDDLRRLPRRRRALRHGLPVRGRRRRIRLDHAAARHPVERREGRRLDAPAADPRDEPAAARCRRRAWRAAGRAGAEELMKVKIDALDITVLRGGVDRHRRVGQEPRLPPPARRARGPRLLRHRSPIFLAAAFDADAAAAARSADRRRDAGPHHDPDRQPVGPAPDPRPRQDRRGADRGRRLPPDRRHAGPPADADRRQRHPPRPQRRGDGIAARPTCAPTAAWSGCPSIGVADEGRRRRGGAAS